MNITINLPIKNKEEKEILEKLLYKIWLKLLTDGENEFLYLQELSLKDVWNDKNLDVYNKYLWNTKEEI